MSRPRLSTHGFDPHLRASAFPSKGQVFMVVSQFEYWPRGLLPAKPNRVGNTPESAKTEHREDAEHHEESREPR